MLVWRFDRFARSTKHLALALKEFRLLGIRMVSHQENIDTTSPLGQALLLVWDTRVMVSATPSGPLLISDSNNPAPPENPLAFIGT